MSPADAPGPDPRGARDEHAGGPRGDEPADGPRGPRGEHDEDHGGLQLTRRKLLAFVAFTVVALVGLYYLLPRLAGLEETWSRMEDGDAPWLLVALLFTVGSFGGYVALFRGVFIRAASGIGWRASFQITMSGLLATRLFAAGGAGGIVLTAWALRRSGMSPRLVADKAVAFLVLTYLVYAVALVVFGFGLAVGLLPGPAPFALTVLPALVGLAGIGLGLAVAFVPTDLERRVSRLAMGSGRLGRWKQKAANIPAAASAGVREAIQHLGNRDPALLGAVAFWAFQIAVLWAAFRAFGEAPPFSVLVLGFFVGMFGNLLPMPAGVGGVEGGMIGALVAFNVEPGLAVVVVLVYRAFVFWLPMLPGAVAYFLLLRTVKRWGEEQERGTAPAGPEVAARPAS